MGELPPCSGQGDGPVTGLHAADGTGELAEVGVEHEIVRHEAPAHADRVRQRSGAPIKLLEHTVSGRREVQVRGSRSRRSLVLGGSWAVRPSS